MRVFLVGYPGELGGANTEAWHTIKLWRRFEVDVHLIPTWGHDLRWRERADALGCTTHDVTPDQLDTIAELPGIGGEAEFRRVECQVDRIAG